MDEAPLQPEGLTQYVQDRQKPRHTLLVFFIIALLILAGGAAWGLMRFSTISDQVRSDEEIAAMIAQERARFTEAFSDLGITPGAIANGFWYTYADANGNEHVLYFDVAALAQQNVSDDELKQIKETLSKSSITERASMRIVPEAELPSDLQFHNAVYSFGSSGMTTLDMKNLLMTKVKSGTVTSEELFQLSYLYELEGNYAERDRLNGINCERFAMRCEEGTVTMTGRVVDNRGVPIQGARVTIVSRPEAMSALTNVNGLYTLRTAVNTLEKLRVGASKRNYSDGYQSAVLVVDGIKTIDVDDITLESPINIVTIDLAKKTVTGAGNHFTSDGSIVVTTSNSVYQIPPDSIVGRDGRPYTEGPIDVYLYEFTKGNPPESLMNVDTFDQVMGYAGDLMKTFGMPYIQFFTQDGVELDVLKSAPMVLTYAIADMDALRANTDQIYEPLTDADMQLLVSASLGQSYRVDREFLINNRLLRFPAFWVFDRRRGVWDNIGVSVLDTEGTIQTIFYTIRD